MKQGDLAKNLLSMYNFYLCTIREVVVRTYGAIVRLWANDNGHITFDMLKLGS